MRYIKMTEETIDWKEGMPYKIGFSEGFIDGFNKGKSQATKEILEEVSKIIENMETINYNCEENIDWIDRDELKQQLQKLGDK